MQKIKNKIPVRHACADPDNSNGEGGSNCFSREVRTSFSPRKQKATYDFHGEVRTPCPLCLHLYQSFKQFGFTFYFLFFGWAWSIHMGAQWLSGRVLDLRLKGRGFEPHRSHCVVVLEQDTFILAWYWFSPGRPDPV